MRDKTEKDREPDRNGHLPVLFVTTDRDTARTESDTTHEQLTKEAVKPSDLNQFSQQWDIKDLLVLMKGSLFYSIKNCLQNNVSDR